MKFVMYLLIAIVLLGSAVMLNAAPPAGASQTVIAFTGGSVWNSDYTGGTCVWYFPILGDLDLKALFAPDGSGNPAVDIKHAYLIWVSDWTIQGQPFGNPGFGGANVTLAIVPTGTATVYYSDNPTGRDLSNPVNPATRSNWGTVVATFVRGGGLFHSPDGFQLTDKFHFSAPLVRSRTFTLGGKPFNFRDLIPHGLTCFEYGQQLSTTETGSCIAMGN